MLSDKEKYLKGRQTSKDNQLLKCFSIQLKIKPKNNLQFQILYKLFQQSKLFYNNILSSSNNQNNLIYNNILSIDSKLDLYSLYKKIRNKDRLGYTYYEYDKEEHINVKKIGYRKVDLLSSQMKLGIYEKIKDNIKGLGVTKGKSKKVGRLKYKSDYNSIILKQLNNTYYLDNNYTKLRLQGIKGISFLILGGDQIKDDFKITTAQLVKKSSGYYLQLTCYKKDEDFSSNNTGAEQGEVITYNDYMKEYKSNKPIIGIDIGLKDQLTISDGSNDCIKIQYSKTKRELKLEQRSKKLNTIMNRKLLRMGKVQGIDNIKYVKKSNNFFNIVHMIGLNYERLDNIKKEREIRIVNELKKYNVILEDIDLKNWQKLWGKKSQWIRLGRLRERLERSTSITLINRFFPSSKQCSCCGNVKENLGLNERIYECGVCKKTFDRDGNAAKNILLEGQRKLKTVPKELGDQYKIKPLEIKTSNINNMYNIVNIKFDQGIGKT